MARVACFDIFHVRLYALLYFPLPVTRACHPYRKYPTTILSSSQPSTSEPQLNVQYCAPEFCLPHPDTVNQFCRDQSNLTSAKVSLS
jgi:hypothetical protein